MSFNIDASQLMEWGRQMGLVDDIIDAAAVQAGNRTAKFGADLARNILRGNGSVVTGGLLNSIRAMPTSVSGNTITVAYGPSEDYPATWVEHGRGAVHARLGGRLAFQIKSRGPYIYTKAVGPAAARPFMEPTIPQAKAMLTKLLGDAILRAINGIK